MLTSNVITFGGGDGGGGVMRQVVQGEVFSQAAEFSRGRYEVEAFSITNYFGELVRRISKLSPQAILIAEPDERGTIVHTQGDVRGVVKRIVEARKYLSSGVSRVVEFSKREYRDVIDRKVEGIFPGIPS
ncbi:MAG: hypothetical protein QF793_00475 [Candidatus Peribacteraceae bacterium]|nr:hypothetical protein [Candidatus Peribacteraceae bacterium]